MDAAFAAWLSMRTMIRDFYLRLRPLTLSPKAFASRKPIHLSTTLHRAGVSDPGYN